jgi:[acyl-carrier-protein] S-malonyltransferase
MLADAADEELYAHAVMVEHRIPMHTPRFEPVAKLFRAALEAAHWKDRARLAYRPNVTATATPFDFPTVLDCLTRHVYQPVLWRHTVDALAAEYPDAVFLEIGPRTVLRDLMLRRWLATRDVFAVDSPDEGIEGAPERVAATLDQVRYALSGAAPRPAPLPLPITSSAR